MRSIGCKCKAPICVKRVWVYTAMPIGKLEYMIYIDKVIKYPEKIKEDGIRK